MATSQLSSLLESAIDVERIRTNAQAHHVSSSVRRKTHNLRHYITAYPRLKKALVQHEQSTIIWTSPSPTALGHMRDVTTVLPALRDKQPVYGIVHWGDFDRVFRNPVTRITAHYLVKRLEGFIFLNHLLAAKSARWIPRRKRFVIPNTVDWEILCSADQVNTHRMERLERTETRLLFLGKMTPSKGYRDVVEALRILRGASLPVRADFIGNWPSQRAAEQFDRHIANAGLNGSVTHHDPISDRKRLKDAYLSADVLVLPTYYPTEAQPLTIIEALNAGTPIITTRQGGIPKMVRENRDALFVAPQEPEAIAEAAKELMSKDRWRAFSESARTRFEEMFYPDVVRAQWMDLLIRDV